MPDKPRKSLDHLPRPSRFADIGEVLLDTPAVTVRKLKPAEIATATELMVAACLPPVEPAKRGRGRPKIEGQRPWEAEGLSRAQWYRRQKEAKGG